MFIGHIPSSSNPSRPAVVPRFRCAQRPCSTRCQATGTTDGNFGEQARRFVQQKSREFSRAVSEATEQVNLRAEEAYKEADSKYAIGRRVRNAIEDFRRRLPYWKEKLDDFGSRPVGKIVFWTLFCLSITSGLLFRVLNVVFLLWWTLPLLLFPLMGIIRSRAEKRMREEQARVAAEEERARNPFSAFSGMGNFGARSAKPAARKSSWADDGPVIDAEWTTIDEPPKR